jgi:hypothetical protein
MTFHSFRKGPLCNHSTTIAYLPLIPPPNDQNNPFLASKASKATSMPHNVASLWRPHRRPPTPYRQCVVNLMSPQ